MAKQHGLADDQNVCHSLPKPATAASDETADEGDAPDGADDEPHAVATADVLDETFAGANLWMDLI